MGFLMMKKNLPLRTEKAISKSDRRMFLSKMQILTGETVSKDTMGLKKIVRPGIQTINPEAGSAEDKS